MIYRTSTYYKIKQLTAKFVSLMNILYLYTLNTLHKDIVVLAGDRMTAKVSVTCTFAFLLIKHVIL